MKRYFLLSALIVVLSSLFCQKEEPAFLPSEESLVLSVLSANETIHGQLMKEEKIPDLTEIRRALAALSDQTHPALKSIASSKDAEFKEGQTDLEGFYKSLSDFSTKLQPVIKKSVAFSEYGAFYCPMVEKTWIAKGLAVRNPFAPEMRDCGDRIP